jgi:hypothetical protein
MLESLKWLLEDERIQQNCTVVQPRVASSESSCMNALSAIEAVAAGALGKNHSTRASVQQGAATV